jgi:predicted nucleotidyltransferase
VDYDRLIALLRALEGHGVDYVLVGGVALNVHGIVRATEDVDLFVRPTADNVERLRSALRAVWSDPDIDEITASDLEGPYPTVRYGPPGESFVIDFMARLGTAFQFDDLRSEDVVIEGVHVRVGSPETLYRMKKDTVRPIDRADAAVLKDKFGLKD